MRKKEKIEKVKKPFYKKWWFIGIIVIVILGAIGSGSDEKTSEEKQESKETVNVEKKKEDIKEPVKEPEIKREDLTLDQYLEYMVKEVLGEKTNMDKPVFVSVSDGDEGIKDIVLNPNDNFTNKMIIGGMQSDATKYLKEISKNEEVMKLKAISLIFQMTLVDAYGNESDNPVFITTVSTETLKKINWDNFFADNLEVVSDTYFVNPALKK